MADAEAGFAQAAAAVRTVSSASADAAVVSESLEGLVSAVDELKRSMGLGEQVDLSEIERFIYKLRSENEEFRQFAEEAIKVGWLGRRQRRLWVVHGASARCGCLVVCMPPAAPLQYWLARQPRQVVRLFPLLGLFAVRPAAEGGAR